MKMVQRACIHHGVGGAMLTTVLQYLFLELYVTGFVETSRMNDAGGGGFSVTRLPALNMFALQCNGSHLPSDVRSVQHISVQRHSASNDAIPYIIASLSSVDGVRLENSQGDANIYVNGVFDADNIQATSLTVLFSDVIMEADVTYGCTISYTKRGGMLTTVERVLNVTSLDLQNMMYRVEARTEPKSVAPPVVASSQTEENKPLWTTPMIMLISMAGLLFILFIICLLLVVERYRDNKRKRRLERLSKKKMGSSKDKGLEQGDRPLPTPPPPTWTYPTLPVGAPPQRSPYHRLRMGSLGRNLPDDTGYDSDASMHYSRPYDDVGGLTLDKPSMETFGKQLAPIYASSHLMTTS